MTEPARFGRFRVEHAVGAGGMGEVFVAVDADTGEKVALKRMRAGGGDEERFEREAAVLASLGHPAIVRYVAHGTLDGGEKFLAMEWLDGEDLATRLDRAALSFADSLALVRRAAEALGHAHASGIVHGDAKPSNLFLVRGDPARVKEAFELASGETVEYRYSFVRLEFFGSETVTRIVFGPEESEPLLGVIALEDAGIGVDPVTRSPKRMAAKPLKRMTSVGARGRR